MAVYQKREYLGSKVGIKWDIYGTTKNGRITLQQHRKKFQAFVKNEIGDEDIPQKLFWRRIFPRDNHWQISYKIWFQ